LSGGMPPHLSSSPSPVSSSTNTPTGPHFYAPPLLSTSTVQPQSQHGLPMCLFSFLFLLCSGDRVHFHKAVEIACACVCVHMCGLW
jgi:hypothetical protein